MPEPTPSSPLLTEALDRLWVKFHPEIDRRVGTLESTAYTLELGVLTDEQRQAACSDAHKLAGILGTFGFHRGTELARRCELALELSPASGAKSATPAAIDPGFAALVTALRKAIEDRNRPR